MPKKPKTCKGCVFAGEDEVVPGLSKPKCSVTGAWISLRDKACEMAKGKPRRRR